MKAAGSQLGVRVQTIYGGRAYEPQIESLRAGTDVIVGTPGRLLDLAQQGHLVLGAVSILVLDEADEMLDLGFLPDIEKLMAMLPAKRQTMLFSATMPGPIVSLARTFLNQPIQIRAEHGSDIPSTEHVEQFAYRAHALDKAEVLARVLQARGRGLTLIFTRTKRSAAKIADDLTERGFAAAAVHGDLGQAAREQALRAFRSGKVDVLVATDVAARGLDVEGVTHVINYQAPDDEMTYVHRIGRTARAGASGRAVTLVDWEDLARWKLICDTLALPLHEPPETYSTSSHLYLELDIPEGVTGRLPNAQRSRVGLAAEAIEDIGGRAPASARTDRDSLAAVAAAVALADRVARVVAAPGRGTRPAGARTDRPADGGADGSWRTERPNRRRRRPRRIGRDAAPAAAVPPATRPPAEPTEAAYAPLNLVGQDVSVTVDGVDTDEPVSSSPSGPPGRSTSADQPLALREYVARMRRQRRYYIAALAVLVIAVVVLVQVVLRTGEIAHATLHSATAPAPQPTSTATVDHADPGVAQHRRDRGRRAVRQGHRRDLRPAHGDRPQLRHGCRDLDLHPHRCVDLPRVPRGRHHDRDLHRSRRVLRRGRHVQHRLRARATGTARSTPTATRSRRRTGRSSASRSTRLMITTPLYIQAVDISSGEDRWTFIDPSGCTNTSAIQGSGAILIGEHCGDGDHLLFRDPYAGDDNDNKAKVVWRVSADVIPVSADELTSAIDPQDRPAGGLQPERRQGHRHPDARPGAAVERARHRSRPRRHVGELVTIGATSYLLSASTGSQLWTAPMAGLTTQSANPLAVTTARHRRTRRRDRRHDRDLPDLGAPRRARRPSVSAPGSWSPARRRRCTAEAERPRYLIGSWTIERDPARPRDQPARLVHRQRSRSTPTPTGYRLVRDAARSSGTGAGCRPTRSLALRRCDGQMVDDLRRRPAVSSVDDRRAGAPPVRGRHVLAARSTVRPTRGLRIVWDVDRADQGSTHHQLVRADRLARDLVEPRPRRPLDRGEPAFGALQPEVTPGAARARARAGTPRPACAPAAKVSVAATMSSALASARSMWRFSEASVCSNDATVPEGRWCSSTRRQTRRSVRAAPSA